MLHAMHLLLSLLACASPTSEADTGASGDDTAAAPNGPSGAAFAEPTCSPDDGGAVRIVVGLDGEGCEAEWSSMPHMRLALWDTAAPLAPGEYPLSMETGSAWYSAAGGPEEFGSSGVISIVAWGDAITGSYSVVLDSGSTVDGTFDAVWCETDPRCG